MMENDKCKELLYLCRDESGKLITNNDNLEKYSKESGVWAMWGKTDGKDYVCLEVGQTQDICKELRYNLRCLEKDYSNADMKKKRSARALLKFSKRFNICECDQNRRDAKYRDIANSYSEIKVYLLCNSNAIKEEREHIEYKYAVDHKALYWNACGKQRKEAILYYKNK